MDTASGIWILSLICAASLGGIVGALGMAMICLASKKEPKP